jgi:hypothetical protein
LETLRGRKIAGSVSCHVFVAGLEVLSLHEALVADLQCGLAKGVRVEIFRLDSRYVSSIAGDLAAGLGGLETLELVVDLGRDVTG